jgi:formiminotetrahydrofolate cyclodeaminase
VGLPFAHDILKYSEAEANAKLIAAAPLLLEALQNFIEAVDINYEEIEESGTKEVYKRIKNSLTYSVARQAIQKAS